MAREVARSAAQQTVGGGGSGGGSNNAQGGGTAGGNANAAPGGGGALHRSRAEVLRGIELLVDRQLPEVQELLVEVCLY